MALTVPPDLRAGNDPSGSIFDDLWPLMETKDVLGSYYRLSSKGLPGLGVSAAGFVDFASVCSS